MPVLFEVSPLDVFNWAQDDLNVSEHASNTLKSTHQCYREYKRKHWIAEPEQMIGNEHVCTLSAMSSHPHGWSFMNIQKAINRQCLQIGYHRKEFYLFVPKCYKNYFQKHSTPLYTTVCLEPSLCHGLVQLFPFRMTYHQSQQTFNSFFVMAKGIQKVPNFQSMGSQCEVQSFPNEWRDCHIVTSSHPTPSVSFCSSIL